MKLGKSDKIWFVFGIRLFCSCTKPIGLRISTVMVGK